MKRIFTGIIICFFSICSVCYSEIPEAPEVELIEKPEARTIIARDQQVIVRLHPRTETPYVSIVSGDLPVRENTIRIPSEILGRPDYRLLSYRAPKNVPAYKGPYSDRTKVYVLAGALITTGIATAAIGAAAPATLGAASSGAGAYAIAGSTVGVTTLATVLLKSRPDPDEDDFTHTSHTRLVEFYGFDE